MFNLCAKIFGEVLSFIYGYVPNYGIAIIIFTIILKLCLLPFNIKQQKTMKKSAALQVKVKEIQTKYSSDALRMQQELTNLYKSENMSPFSGCLLTIFQFIVILSMFYLVSKPLTYMSKVDMDTISTYVKQIQESGESNQLRYPEIAVIRNYGEKDSKVNINMDFLGLKLSSIPVNDYNDWKVFIIPTLYVITSFVSMKLTNKQNAENMNTSINKGNSANDTNLPEKVDEQAELMAQMNKNMSLMMPFMTVSIALIAPLGLALYWFVSNLLAIGERFIIKKVMKAEEEKI